MSGRRENHTEQSPTDLVRAAPLRANYVRITTVQRLTPPVLTHAKQQALSPPAATIQKPKARPRKKEFDPDTSLQCDEPALGAAE